MHLSAALARQVVHLLGTAVFEVGPGASLNVYKYVCSWSGKENLSWLAISKDVWAHVHR